MEIDARRAGCLLGGAVGDAFGYAVEFDSWAQIRARYGRKGIREPRLSREGLHVVSDDTQMTMFTLEGLLRGFETGELLPEIRRAYLDWLDTQDEAHEGFVPAGSLVREPVMRARRAPGTTCLSALADAEAAGSIDRPVNDSKGCGGVMRSAPLGLFPARLSTREAFRLGAETAALTHGHPSGYLSAGALSAMVRELIEGATPDAAAQTALEELRTWRGHEETSRAIEAALAMAHDGHGEIARLGAGWVGEEALAIGLYSALAATDFRETVALAANHGGDSDSTASIAGQLRGAWKGVDEIPTPWIERLDVLVPLQSLLSRAGAVR